jgi:hypothetical protein
VPHLLIRWDRRDNDNQRSYEGRAGIKLFVGRGGYADMYYDWRQYFDVATNQQINALFGVDTSDDLSLEIFGSAMHSRPRSPTPVLMLYEAGFMARLGLGAITKSFKNLDLTGQYQGFFEPNSVYHVFLARLAYRYRG